MWKRQLVSGVLAAAGLAACARPSGTGAVADSSGAGMAHELPNAPAVEVKFREELEVRLEAGRLHSRRGASLKPVHALLERHRAVGVHRLITSASDSLAALAREAEARSGARAPDLASWYRIVFPPDADPDRIAAELAALPEVQHAYPAPRPAPPPASGFGPP